MGQGEAREKGKCGKIKDTGLDIDLLGNNKVSDNMLQANIGLTLKNISSTPAEEGLMQYTDLLVEVPVSVSFRKDFQKGLRKQNLLQPEDLGLSKEMEDVVMVEETRKNAKDMERLLVLWKFNLCLAVNKLENGGGLALLWMKDSDLTIKSYSSHYIDALMGNVGDFNELLSSDEKCGGAMRLIIQMNAFERVLEDCELQEIPVTWPMFTWSRGTGYQMILERLDRGVANPAWLNMFPAVRKKHVIAEVSDHLPLVFEL
ncbi:hypothetical protein PTKIN_Ptkin02bG0142600 [Pterospermum kingtungense]